MRSRALPPRIQRRFRELVMVLYSASITLALVGVRHAFSSPVGPLAIGWGIAAGAFGLLFVIRAIVSFMYNDEDFVESWSVLAAGMFGLFALGAFNYLGLAAGVVVIAAWALGKVGHRWEERSRMEGTRRRREALGSKETARAGTQLLDETQLDLPERWKQHAETDHLDDHPSTRKGAQDRARIIDGNPWDLPPN